MSVKKQVDSLFVSKNGRQTYMEDGLILVTDRKEAVGLPTDTLVEGCMLYVIREGALYMLDEDGGAWYNVSTGAAITAEGGAS